MMHSKSHILAFCAGLLVVISVSISFYRYMILEDYFIYMEVPCDPILESCFVRTCNPETDEECVEVEKESYYKFISKKAYLMPECNPNDALCTSPTCEGDETCEEFVCVSEELSDGELCDVL